MELIKRKILLEDSIDRNYDSLTWGQVTATTFYINVMVTKILIIWVCLKISHLLRILRVKQLLT
jgi:hypothetical protein